MGDITINSEQFFSRLGKLEQSLVNQKAELWDGMDALCVPMGPPDESVPYSKGAALHLYLMGYEFPESIILITKGNFYFMATAKKCRYLKELMDKQDENTNSIKMHLLEKTKDDGANRELMHNMLGAARKNHGSKLGCFYKQEFEGKFIPGWMEMIKGSGLDMIEAAPGVGKLLCVKEDNEIVSAGGHIILLYFSLLASSCFLDLCSNLSFYLSFFFFRKTAGMPLCCQTRFSSIVLYQKWKKFWTMVRK